MEKYVLTQDLVTGNELIDSEHRKIFDEVNTLLDACSKGKGRENLSSLGEFLVEYVTKHFSDEEDLQKQSKYRNIQNIINFMNGINRNWVMPL